MKYWACYVMYPDIYAYLLQTTFHWIKILINEKNHYSKKQSN